MSKTLENEARSSKGSILFLSKRRDAASTRYRIFQYADALQAQGWHVDYRSTSFKGLGLIARWRLIQLCNQFSIIVIQRKLFDALTLVAIHRANPSIVFDYDDAIFLNDDGSSSTRRLKRFTKTTQLAQLVLAGNGYLAAQSQASNTHVFPTTIQFNRYAALPAPEKSAQTPLTLVWIGSRATQKYLEQHREIFEAIGQAIDGVKLKIISDFPMAFKHLNVQCIPWSAETELKELAAADIGIAPMIDDPWTRGKCALKVIQYMACGLPVVSANCGANAEIVVHNETGFLADNANDWIAAIQRLENAELRYTMGEKGRARAKAYYSAEAQVTVLDELLTKMLTR